MAKRGPKNIVIDWDQFDKLCVLHCTLEEIAGMFDCCADTIETLVKKKYKKKFSDIFRQKAAKGKMSLRRKQYQVAMSDKANNTMLIWLGKQWLKQTDKYEINEGDPESEKLEYIPRDTIPWKRLPK